MNRWSSAQYPMLGVCQLRISTIREMQDQQQTLIESVTARGDNSHIDGSDSGRMRERFEDNALSASSSSTEPVDQAYQC